MLDTLKSVFRFVAAPALYIWRLIMWRYMVHECQRVLKFTPGWRFTKEQLASVEAMLVQAEVKRRQWAINTIGALTPNSSDRMIRAAKEEFERESEAIDVSVTAILNVADFFSPGCKTRYYTNQFRVIEERMRQLTPAC